MPHIDAKLVLVAALLALLVVVKLLAGGKPWDTPVRRRRRFGHRGDLGPLRNPEVTRKAPEPPPRDPEKDFFGDSGDS